MKNIAMLYSDIHGYTACVDLSDVREISWPFEPNEPHCVAILFADGDHLGYALVSPSDNTAYTTENYKELYLSLVNLWAGKDSEAAHTVTIDRDVYEELQAKAAMLDLARLADNDRIEALLKQAPLESSNDLIS